MLSLQGAQRLAGICSHCTHLMGRTRNREILESSLFAAPDTGRWLRTGSRFARQNPPGLLGRCGPLPIDPSGWTSMSRTRDMHESFPEPRIKSERTNGKHIQEFTIALQDSKPEEAAKSQFATAARAQRLAKNAHELPTDPPLLTKSKNRDGFLT